MTAIGLYLKGERVHLRNSGQSGGFEDNQGQFVNDVFSKPMSHVSAFSILCGDAAASLDSIDAVVASKLGVSPLHIEILAIDNHVVAQYYDLELNKWVLIDADPQTYGLIFCKNGVPASALEISADASILTDTTSIFNPRLKKFPEDSLGWANLSDNMNRHTRDSSTFASYQTNEIGNVQEEIVYKLLPNQEMTIDYEFSILGLVVGTPECGEGRLMKEMDSLRLFVEDYHAQYQPNIDVNHFIDAITEEVTPMVDACFPGLPYFHFVWNLVSENLDFADIPEAYAYGVSNDYSRTFSISFEPGIYSNEEVYIPNIIRRVSAECSVDNILLDNAFSLMLYDSMNVESGGDSIMLFEDVHTLTDGIVVNQPTSIEFWGNLELLLDVITIQSGSITVKEYINGVEVIEDSISTSIAEILYEDILLFPNPTTGFVNLSESAPVDSDIYNSLAQKIGKIEKGDKDFDLSDLPNGIYFIPKLDKKIIKK